MSELPDLRQAMDRLAAKSSAEFIMKHMPKANAFRDPVSVMGNALIHAPTGGMALEFGVATGRTLRMIASYRGDGKVYGFDSFNGLPETWRTHFPKGAFAESEIPHVEGADIIIGMFEKTLDHFLAEHDDPIDFVHIDSDLYSSAKTALDLAIPRLSPDAIILFDEYFNYPTWEQHEHRAWMESVYTTKFNLEFEYMAYCQKGQQVAVRVNQHN